MPKNKRSENSSSSDSDSAVEDNSPPPKKVAKKTGSIRTDDKEPTWALSSNKLVKIRDFKGKTYVDIREYWEKGGEQLPGKKGIMLPVEMWKKLISASDEINEAIDAVN